MHPTPRHEASHGACVGARVMPGVRPLSSRVAKLKVSGPNPARENGCASRAGRDLVHRVAAPVAIDGRGALRIISICVAA
jgi:hypothetical protein